MKNFKKEIIIWIIALVSAIVWWVFTSLFSNKFVKDNEIETRVFELKKTVYEDFLNIYFNSFNNENIRKKYEEIFRDKIVNNLSFTCLYHNDWLFYENNEKLSFLLEKDIKSCFYQKPENCISLSWNYCFWILVNISWFNESIKFSIWETQDESMKLALNEIYWDFQKKTYKYQILLPKDIYKKVFDLIEEKLYLAVNNYYDCDWETSPSCWFNFNLVNIISNTNKDYFINQWIMLDLRDDLQKHY